MSVEEYLNSKFRELNLPGFSCCVAYGNKMSTFNFGKSDLETETLVCDRSIFNIASVGKLITTVCVFSLIEKGTLTLNTHLGELLSDIPHQWRSVKVSHLLTHSSGIRNYTDVPDYWNEYYLDVPKARIVEYVKDSNLEFKPGSHWKYSNTGFYLLGLIIEKLSGRDYFDFATHIIAAYKPGLKIIKTDDRKTLPGRVTGYVQQASELVKPPYYSNSGTFSAGGFSATLSDFIDFENGLFNGKILNNDSLSSIIKPFVKEDGSVLSSPDPAFGFVMTHGLFRFNSSGKAFLAHGGEIFGYKAEYMRVVDDNFSVIVATNLDRNFDSLKMLMKIYSLAISSVDNPSIKG